jgi:hypothetical protein
MKPWRIPLSPVHRIVPELRKMSDDWLTELGRRGVYTADELAALRSPANGRQCSWAATPAQLAGPVTHVVLVNNHVIGGVELWQNQQDRYWFLEGLVRDQDARYHGAGRDVVSVAIMWVMDVIRDSGRRYGLRVHAMVREEAAVSWWTHYLGREPDFDTAFITTANFRFPAFGWIMVPTP